MQLRPRRTSRTTAPASSTMTHAAFAAVTARQLHRVHGCGRLATTTAAATIDDDSLPLPSCGRALRLRCGRGTSDATLAGQRGLCASTAFDAAGVPDSARTSRLNVDQHWRRRGHLAGRLGPGASRRPTGACAAIGGFNSFARGLQQSWGITRCGPPHWQSSAEGTYSRPRWTSTGSGLSGSRQHGQAYLFNGYGGSSGAQFNATWTVSGLCNGSTDGGGGPGHQRLPPGPGRRRHGDRVRRPHPCWVTSAACRRLLAPTSPATGQSTTSDMLVFLGAFGEVCELKLRAPIQDTKKPRQMRGFLSVPGAGLEPARPYGPTDFKSVVSTNSTIRAGRRS